MADNAKVIATMIANIETQTGHTMDQLIALVKASPLTKHAELRKMVSETYGLGYGQANTVVHLAKQDDGAGSASGNGSSGTSPLDTLYTGKKADLRPVHDAVLSFLETLGDFEMAPKKGYVSYRRQKQFLMVGPKTNTAVELGFGAKALPSHARLKEMPPSSMCRYTTRLSDPSEVDATVRKWIRQSYDEAG